jgi:hypothetical protein
MVRLNEGKGVKGTGNGGVGWLMAWLFGAVMVDRD